VQNDNRQSTDIADELMNKIAIVTGQLHKGVNLGPCIDTRNMVTALQEYKHTTDQWGEAIFNMRTTAEKYASKLSEEW
jgi:response regulator of citrate/malate metabolism